MSKEKICGVYMITSKTTGKIYIGSSININTRWNQHINKLNKNLHGNIHLQNAWNKYGQEDFIFEIIEKCNENELRDREQYYIDKTKCTDHTIGYNIMPKTNMSEISDETKDKISNTLKGKFIGENCFYSKISEEIAKNIISDLFDNTLSYDEISKRNNVSKSIVCSICYGYSWNYLTKYIEFPKRISGHNGLNKLHDSDIPEITNFMINGLSDTEIGRIFNVNRKTISDIRNHKTWTKYTDGISLPKTRGQKKNIENNNNKLTTFQVKEIKEKISSNISLAKIASEYNVSVTNISNIKNNKIYTYV